MALIIFFDKKTKNKKIKITRIKIILLLYTFICMWLFVLTAIQEYQWILIIAFILKANFNLNL
jgi:hypothetical protein